MTYEVRWTDDKGNQQSRYVGKHRDTASNMAVWLYNAGMIVYIWCY